MARLGVPVGGRVRKSRAVKDGLPTPSGDGKELGGLRSTRAVETTPVVSLKTDRGRDAGKVGGQPGRT